MGKSDPPPAPDYRAAAIEQGKADKETTMWNAAVNRPDEFSPTGSRTWEIREGADIQNLKPGDIITRTSLSPEQQKLYDMDVTNKLGMGNLSNQMLDTVSSSLGTKFDMSKLGAVQAMPTATTTGAGPQLRAGYLDAGPQAFGSVTEAGPQIGGTNISAGPRIAANRSLENTARSFNPTAYSQDREVIAKAVYDSMTRRNQDQFDRQEAQLRDRLVNQGLDENSKAFKDQIADFTEAKNAAYQEAARQAEIAGSQEQTRQDTSQGQAFQQQLGANQANFEQKANAVSNNFAREQGAAATNFGTGKEAVESNYNRTAGSNQQNFAQMLAAMESNFNRQQVAGSQNFGQQSAAIDSNFSRGLAANQQNFGQGVQAYQASMAGRQQDMQEQAYLRSLPLNEINAVRSGAQVSMPQFQNYATGFAAAAPNLYGATKDAYAAEQANTNAKNAATGQLLGTAAKLGAAYMTGGTSLMAG